MEYEFLAGNLALDFANTVHSHGAEDPGDDLTSINELEEWARQSGILSSPPVRSHHPQIDEPRAFRRALALREAIYRFFSSIAENERPSDAALFTLQKMHRASARTQVLVRKGKGFEFVWPDSVHPIERIMAEVSRSAGELLTSDALKRVRQCSSANCSWLFVDQSRGGRRRWCDMRVCGNRAKIHRFRNPQKCSNRLTHR